MSSASQYNESSEKSNISEGVLLGLGNPLLDITVCTDKSFLDKYGLQANNAILDEGDKYQKMFQDMMENYKPTYIAGGATQNTIRVAQWLLGKDKATTFFGCVGDDDRANILREKGLEVGVNVRYQVTKEENTGVCAAIITGEDRSLVSHLGAANFFTHHFLEDRENWMYVQRARCFYIGGFVFPVSVNSILDIAKHACDNNKILVMNLSAPFLCKYFADPAVDILQYVDVLFGNSDEAAEFCKHQGIETSDLEQMALKTSMLPKKNKSRNRWVIFTQGKDPTVIAANGNVAKYGVEPVEKSIIKDTNGCGDAFVGGFLSELVQGHDVTECLRCGQYAARVVIQHFGCTYPEYPDF